MMILLLITITLVFAIVGSTFYSIDSVRFLTVNIFHGLLAPSILSCNSSTLSAHCVRNPVHLKMSLCIKWGLANIIAVPHHIADRGLLDAAS